MGHFVMTKIILVNKFCRIDQTDNRMQTVFHMGAEHDRLEILDLLYKHLKHSIFEIQADSKGNFPLQIAGKFNRTLVVQYILEYHHQVAN